jgi:hypothetical protein
MPILLFLDINVSIINLASMSYTVAVVESTGYGPKSRHALHMFRAIVNGHREEESGATVPFSNKWVRN